MEQESDHYLRREEAMLLALLRAALWQQRPDYGPFEAIDEAAWKRVRQLATMQGVQAVAFDGMMRLPSLLQPPREVRMAWAVNAERLAEHNRRYKGVAVSLADMYASYGLRTMLMKGPGLAQLYPIPEHRESGDLDVWLFGHWAEGDRIIRAQGIKVEQHTPKHSNFYYKGIPVENHRHFLNVEQCGTDRLLEPALRAALPANGEGLPAMDGSRILLPTAGFNALFLARHMTTHFVDHIVLRHLCDWALFLHASHGSYAPAAFVQHTDAAGLGHILRHLTTLCTVWLGMPAGDSPYAGETAVPHHHPACTAEQVLEWILRPRYTALPEGAPVHRIIAFKLRRLAEQRGRYRIVYGGGFYRRIAKSVVSHIVHPSTILRLK